MKIDPSQETVSIYEITRKSKSVTGLAAFVHKQGIFPLTGAAPIEVSEKGQAIHPCACDFSVEVKDFLKAWKEGHEPSRTLEEKEFIHRIWKIQEGEAWLFFRKFLEETKEAYLLDGTEEEALPERLKAVFFDVTEAPIRPCHRLVPGLNGIQERAFLNSLKFHFELVGMPFDFPCRPVEPHSIGMYAAGGWYLLTAYQDVYEKEKGAGQLELSILENKILRLILKLPQNPSGDQLEIIREDRNLRFGQGLAEEKGGAFFILPAMEAQTLICYQKQGISLPPELYYVETPILSQLLS